MLMKKEDSCLVLIDIQERLTPVMDNPRDVIDSSSRLVKAARLLNVPVLVTEQYPKGLGPTMFDVRNELSDFDPVEKTVMSAWKEPVFAGRLKETGKKQVILTGIEAHVCVLQTAFDLKEAGYDVFVVSDACSSRKKTDKELAEKRFSAGGVFVVSTEMVLFEWLERSGSPEFKEIQKTLVR